MIALRASSATGSRIAAADPCRNHPPPLDVRVVHGHGGARLVVLVGELDLATAPYLRAAVGELRGGRTRLRFDLSRVDFMDCAGLSLLCELQAQGDRQGCSVVFDPRISRPVARILDLTAQRAALRWSA